MQTIGFRISIATNFTEEPRKEDSFCCRVRIARNCTELVLDGRDDINTNFEGLTLHVFQNPHKLSTLDLGERGVAARASDQVIDLQRMRKKSFPFVKS